MTYRKTWEIALDLLRRSGPDLPHKWVVGDDEFGRASEFRAALRDDHKWYVLDVPCNTTVRDLDAVGRHGRKGARAASVRSRSCGWTPGPESCRPTAGPA